MRKRYLSMLPCKRAVQLVWKPEARELHSIGETELLVTCASEFLDYLV